MPRAEPARSGRRRIGAREAGFALLIVLWTVGLIALVGTQVTSAGRSEARLAANLRSAAVAEAAADGALYEAIYHMIDASTARWPPGGPPHQIRLPHAVAEVSAIDQGGKIDINMASLPLMTSLFRQLGVDARAAQSLSAAIADWRSPSNRPLPQGAKAPQYRAAGLDYGPPNAPFRSLEELRLVLGMTPELYARIVPYLTLHLEGNPELPLAAPPVAQALADAVAAGAADTTEDPDRPPLVIITSTAVAEGGGRFTRRALVRLNVGYSGGAGRAPYEIITWHSGDQS